MKPASLLIIVLLSQMLGQTHARADDDTKAVILDLENPQRALYPMAIPRGVGSDADLVAQVANVASFNLGVSGWFQVLDRRILTGALESEGMQIDSQAWKNVGAFGVIKYRAERLSGDEVELQFRLYEIEKGDEPVLSRDYRGSELRNFIHQWCNDVVRYYTGEPGFFGSKIAFVSRSRSGKRQIMAMDFDGHGTYALTRNRSLNLLPAWSPDGASLVFTSYMRNNPDLYVVNAAGGRPKRLSKHRGMNTGASWSPDGSKIALTLSKDENPEIYIIESQSGKILTRLTRNRYIDISPVWSPNGREIAFVSDREGSPQIFVMNTDGTNQRRVSMNGNYNTTPVWSPRPKTRMVAYTTRDRGQFDIVTLDLDSNQMVRITQNQGNNEEPSFSPNGRSIAFASDRKEGAGIYMANADGSGSQHRIYTGNATSISWGPAPRN